MRKGVNSQNWFFVSFCNRTVLENKYSRNILKKKYLYVKNWLMQIGQM